MKIVIDSGLLLLSYVPINLKYQHLNLFNSKKCSQLNWFFSVWIYLKLNKNKGLTFLWRNH